jgi:hypothetical protein
MIALQNDADLLAKDRRPPNAGRPKTAVMRKIPS